MKKTIIPLLAILFISLSCGSKKPQSGHQGFVQIHKVIPDIVYDIRYYSADNFVGARVDGYLKPTAYISREAANALIEVHNALKKEGLGLKVFDAYRPQKAVDHFVRWGEVIADTLTKSKYYPEIKKARVFDLGYVAKRSGHTRGSTIDLTIVNLETREEMDMGSPWDFFGAISHHDTNLVGEIHTANRNKLRSLMLKYGYKEYANEWWHYTLKDEPYPDTYFDFNVE